MSAFSPVTETELARARSDPAFRQKLLAENLDVLLAGLKEARNKPPGRSTQQLREGVALAVRLAELIQAKSHPSAGA